MNKLFLLMIVGLLVLSACSLNNIQETDVEIQEPFGESYEEEILFQDDFLEDEEIDLEPII